MQVMNEDNNVFNVLETAMGQLEKNIAKLNKKAASWGLTPITLSVIGSHNELVTLKTARWYDGKPQQVSRLVMECTIEGFIPKLNGWTMVAACEITASGNIIRTVPGWPSDVTIPEEYRTRRYCDHCDAARPKKDTFILMNEDGAWMQVGRNCLADFMGADSINAVNYWNVCHKLLDELWSKTTYMTGSSRDYNSSLTEIMITTARVIGGLGYTSNGKAYEQGGIATSTHVSNLMFGSSSEVTQYLLEKCPPVVGEEGEVVAAIEWAKGLEGTNDYEHNIKIIAECGYVSWKSFGMAVSLLPSFRRSTQKAAEKPAFVKPISEFIGNVKDRLEFGAVEVLRTNMVSSNWGLTTVVSFQDKSGNQFVWFASGNPGLEVGGVYESCKATVKSHNVFRGEKQTTVKNAVFGSKI